MQGTLLIFCGIAGNMTLENSNIGTLYLTQVTQQMAIKIFLPENCLGSLANQAAE